MAPPIFRMISSARIALTYGSSIGFIVLIRLYIRLFRPDIEDVEHRIRDVPAANIQPEYDFVIVGGGSAGAAVAHRLSENANWTVSTITISFLIIFYILL